MPHTKRALIACTQLIGGGAAYGALEILWRGYTHISMVFVGGICFCLLVRISKTRLSLPAQCVAGSAGITAVEFAAGCLLNLGLGLDVWDYSDEAYHLIGQICPKYCLIWCGLCAAVLPACRYVSRLCENRFPRRFPGAQP